jgi:GTPase SAR1 family protein/DNA-binding Lrp family transcriptional regulator
LLSETLAYLSYSEMEMVSWNRSKIMLVGQGRAGKTALARTMMGVPFRETPSTIGGELFEREIREGSVKRGKLAEHKRPEKELEWMIAKNGMKMEEKKYFITKTQSTSDFPSEEVHHGEPRGRLGPIKKAKIRNERKVGIRDVDRDAVYKLIAENINTRNDLSKLTISLCDFGGQEVFNALHAFFMTRCGVYMLVFDMELFLSKDEKDRESCHENIKFWMNSIAMHTYDEKTGKTAPLALVGTRKDRISNVDIHDKISGTLEEIYGSHRVWPSLIQFQREEKSSLFRLREPTVLNFFPIDNTKRFFESSTLTQLLEKLEKTMMENEVVKRKIPLVWMKVLDQIREKNASFLLFDEVVEIGEKLGISLEEVSELLRYLYEMGVIIWIEEPGLREVVILDPMEYFVKPVTRIICKHLASRKDPYATKHELPIHEECRQGELSEDWKLMLEFGLVSGRLARRLLANDELEEEQSGQTVESLLQLMKRFGLLIPIHFKEVNEARERSTYFVPSLAPDEPNSIIISENNYEERKILARLHRRYLALSGFRASWTVFLAFSPPTMSSDDFILFSSATIEKKRFLPNGLFDRFIARILSNLPDLVVKSNEVRFIAFKDMVRIDCNGKLIRLTNHSHQNMIKIEIEEGNSVSNLRELVEEWLEVVKKLIRECYKRLEVRVLLPVDCEQGKNGLISLEGLLVKEQSMIPEYISEDGLCRLTRAKFFELQSNWSPLVPVVPIPVNPTNPTHIMLSYCWGYKKDHVIAMEKKLKENGYDMWRDENGSSIVPPLAGDTDESMARAVEKSSLIIIFVCKAYFNSMNCKKEAQYCSEKQKPLLFVMLDENYHPSSSPEAVRGWLGFIIGTRLWYPLWDLEQHLESTTSLIADRIGNTSLLSQKQPLAAVTPPPGPLILQPLVNSPDRINPSHIMFSYAWGSNKDNVVALEDKLKQFGYDIWRDENGSSIVPAMGVGGSTFDCMARAVENSSWVIIFVSKKYYNSENCKTEAQYCSQKRKKILFVMVDETYHTHSSPEKVVGWLGLLLRSRMWCPLWNLDQQLEATSFSIANKIGNISLLYENQQLQDSIASPATLQFANPNPSHIMLSYSSEWNKDYVIAMERKLKEKGYDIWRDENGSFIAPAMGVGGSTLECLARAVENSSWVIIFVSKKYFNCENCKTEAEYCNQKRKPLLFVMLEENYHTLSFPEEVEGWLGLMIGTRLWYALWNIDEQLESTSAAIANRIGNTSLLSQNQQCSAVTVYSTPFP